MSSTEHAEWKKTGKLPETSSTSAASSPAEPAAQAPASPAASHPATPTKNADTRKAQLNAEIRAEAKRLNDLREARLREEGRLQALRQPQTDVTRPVSSPEPADTIEPTRAKPSEDEIGTKYENYAAFVEDLTDWKVEQREARARVTEERTTRETELTKHVESFRKHFTDDPTLASQIAPAVRELTPSSLLPRGVRPNGMSEIAERFLKSPVGLPLMRHFSNHPEDLQRFAAYGPDEFYMELGVLERELKAASAQAPAPAVPPTKHTTSAPPPPTTLGARPAEPADPIQAALRRGDFATYRDLKNKAEIAGKR